MPLMYYSHGIYFLLSKIAPGHYHKIYTLTLKHSTEKKKNNTTFHQVPPPPNEKTCTQAETIRRKVLLYIYTLITTLLSPVKLRIL